MPPCMQRLVFWFSSRLRVGKLFGVPPTFLCYSFFPFHPKRSTAPASLSVAPSPFLFSSLRVLLPFLLLSFIGPQTVSQWCQPWKQPCRGDRRFFGSISTERFFTFRIFPIRQSFPSSPSLSKNNDALVEKNFTRVSFRDTPISRLYSIGFGVQPLWNVTRVKRPLYGVFCFILLLVISFACNLNFPFHGNNPGKNLINECIDIKAKCILTSVNRVWLLFFSRETKIKNYFSHFYAHAWNINRVLG